MPEKTKPEKESEQPVLREAEKETKNRGETAKDQFEKSYYYDDSYGYEIYNPDEDDKEDADETLFTDNDAEKKLA